LHQVSTEELLLELRRRMIELSRYATSVYSSLGVASCDLTA
jgi:hypothetical protein